MGSDPPQPGPRFRDPNWHRPISTIPDDGAANRGRTRLNPYHDMIIEYGIEHGWWPDPRFDASDSLIGLVGIDFNDDGRLQQHEIIGVIGRCGVFMGDNDFYIDEKGYIHWENYSGDTVVYHYIYDPNRNILTIYDKDGNRIYEGPPTNWHDKLKPPPNNDSSGPPAVVNPNPNYRYIP